MKENENAFIITLYHPQLGVTSLEINHFSSTFYPHLLALLSKGEAYSTSKWHHCASVKKHSRTRKILHSRPQCFCNAVSQKCPLILLVGTGGKISIVLFPRVVASLYSKPLHSLHGSKNVYEATGGRKHFERTLFPPDILRFCSPVNEYTVRFHYV